MADNENIELYPPQPENPNDYEGFEKSVYYIFSLLRLMYYSKVESENKFFSKLGGTVGGNVTIQGNLVVNGQNYSIDTTSLNVSDYTITLAKENTQTLTSMVGMVVPKYDGTNYGFFGWDADGYAYVGDLTDYDGTSDITLANNSSLQRIATIDASSLTTVANGKIMIWDSVAHQFKVAPNGTYVIKNGVLVQGYDKDDVDTNFQTKIDSSHKLSADNVDDTSTTNKFITSTQSDNINKNLYHLGVYDTYIDNNDDTITITRKTGYVDLGTLTYNQNDNVFLTSISDIKIQTISNLSSVLTSIYTTLNATDLASMKLQDNMTIAQRLNEDQVMFINNSYSTASDFKTAMSGIMLYYETSTSYTETVIKNQPLNTLDQKGSQWVQDEYEKTTNLFNISDNNLILGVNPNSVSYTITDDIITFNISDTTISELYFGFANSTMKNTNKQAVIKFIGIEEGELFLYKNGVGNIGDLANGVVFNECKDFVVNSTYWISTYPSSVKSSYSFKIMVNYGTTAEPYQPYNGSVVHEKSITPVLLWENGSPNSSYGGGNETTSDMSKYKYIVIMYKINSGTNEAPTVFKYAYGLNKNMYAGIIDTSSASKYHRYSKATSATNMFFSDGYKDGSSESSSCIPIAIYGTNVL